MHYTILLIAVECLSSHVSRFVRNLKLENPEVTIHLLTNYDEPQLPHDIISFVDRIIPCTLTCGLGRLDRLLKIFKMRKPLKQLSQNSRYDIINIQFPHYYMAGIFRYLRRMSKTIVVTPWGSDILRVEGMRKLILMNRVLAKCDYITGEIEGNIGREIVRKLPNCRNKFYPMVWGSETIDYIIKHIGEIDTDSAKNHFGISEDKYVITCGYNAFRAQNHITIIDSIVQIRSDLPKSLLLLFPVTYGTGDDRRYIEELKRKCKEENLEAVFIDHYLSVREVFMLRMATDMFVHAQTTDAGCASLQEYILCNKKIVHGGWIRYPMLEAFSPLCYYVSPDYTMLGRTILEAFNSDPIIISQDVLAYIRSNGWEESRKRWNEMFQQLASTKDN